MDEKPHNLSELQVKKLQLEIEKTELDIELKRKKLAAYNHLAAKLSEWIALAITVLFIIYFISQI